MINKLIFYFVLLSLALSVMPVTSAHPIDVASVVIPMEGEKLVGGGYKIPITWSFTLPEVATALKINFPQPQTRSGILDVSIAKIPISNYLADKVILTTDKGNCIWQTDHLAETIALDDLSFIVFHGFTVCPVLPDTFTVTITAFLKEFPYQTNIVIVTKDGRVVLQKELTALEKTVSYPDGSEPLTADREPTKLNSGSLTAQFEDTFRNILVSSLPGAIIVALFVGFLHSLEAGHSKTILTSLMLDKQTSMKQGFLYSLVFTITHIADIAVFGVILLVLNTSVNIFSIIGQLNRYAALALLWIAAYMFVTNIITLVKTRKHPQEHDHGHPIQRGISFKKQLWIGFLTGLAPCVMGWSIFFLILSTKTVWAVIPVILAFGGGIFLSLAGTTVLVYWGKETLFKHASFLSIYSPLLSSLLLLLFSIFLIL